MQNLSPEGQKLVSGLIHSDVVMTRDVNTPINIEEERHLLGRRLQEVQTTAAANDPLAKPVTTVRKVTDPINGTTVVTTTQHPSKTTLEVADDGTQVKTIETVIESDITTDKPATVRTGQDTLVGTTQNKDGKEVVVVVKDSKDTPALKDGAKDVKVVDTAEGKVKVGTNPDGKTGIKKENNECTAYELNQCKSYCEGGFATGKDGKKVCKKYGSLCDGDMKCMEWETKILKENLPTDVNRTVENEKWVENQKLIKDLTDKIQKIEKQIADLEGQKQKEVAILRTKLTEKTTERIKVKGDSDEALKKKLQQDIADEMKRYNDLLKKAQDAHDNNNKGIADSHNSAKDNRTNLHNDTVRKVKNNFNEREKNIRPIRNKEDMKKEFMDRFMKNKKALEDKYAQDRQKILDQIETERKNQKTELQKAQDRMLANLKNRGDQLRRDIGAEDEKFKKIASARMRNVTMRVTMEMISSRARIEEYKKKLAGDIENPSKAFTDKINQIKRGGDEARARLAKELADKIKGLQRQITIETTRERQRWQEKINVGTTPELEKLKKDIEAKRKAIQDRMDQHKKDQQKLSGPTPEELKKGLDDLNQQIKTLETETTRTVTKIKGDHDKKVDGIEKKADDQVKKAEDEYKRLVEVTTTTTKERIQAQINAYKKQIQDLNDKKDKDIRAKLEEIRKRKDGEHQARVYKAQQELKEMMTKMTTWKTNMINGARKIQADESRIYGEKIIKYDNWCRTYLEKYLVQLKSTQRKQTQIREKTSIVVNKGGKKLTHNSWRVKLVMVVDWEKVNAMLARKKAELEGNKAIFLKRFKEQLAGKLTNYKKEHLPEWKRMLEILNRLKTIAGSKFDPRTVDFNDDEMKKFIADAQKQAADRVKALEQQNNREIVKITTTQKVKITDIKKKFDDLVAKTNKEKEAQKAKAKADSDRAIVDVKNKTDEEIKNIKKEYAKKIADAQKKRDQDKKQNQETYNREIEQMKRELQKLITELEAAQEKYKLIEKEKVTEKVRIIEKNFEDQIKKLNEQYKKAIEDSQKEEDEKIKQLNEQRIKDLRDDAQKKVDAENKRVEEIVRKIIEDTVWKKEHQDKKDAALKKLNDDHDKEVEEIKNLIKKENDVITKTFTDKINKLIEMLEKLKNSTKIPTVEEALERFEKIFQDQINTDKKDQADREKKHQDEIKKLEDQYKKDMDDLKKKLDEATGAEKDRHQKSIDELKKEHEARLKKLNDDFKKAVENLKGDHEKEITRIKVTMTEKINETIKKFDDQIEALKKQLPDLKKKLDDAKKAEISKTKTVVVTIEREVTREIRKCKKMLEGMSSKVTKYRCISREEHNKREVCLKDKKAADGTVTCAQVANIYPIVACGAWTYTVNQQTKLRHKECTKEKIVYPRYTCVGSKFEVGGKKYCTEKKVSKPLFFCAAHEIVDGKRVCKEEDTFNGKSLWKFRCKKEGKTVDDNTLGAEASGCMEIEKVPAKETTKSAEPQLSFTDFFDQSGFSFNGFRRVLAEKDTNTQTVIDNLDKLNRRDREIISACF